MVNSTLAKLRRRLSFQAYRRGYRLLPERCRPRANGPRVLLYHHVADVVSPLVRNLNITISRRDFEEHVRYLSAEWRVIPFSQVIAGERDPRAVAVTFDDGLLSAMTTALPILEKYDCPFKVYLNGSQMAGKLSWLNQISYLMDVWPEERIASLARNCVANDSSRAQVPHGSLWDFIENFDPARTPQAIDAEFQRTWSKSPLPKLYLDETDVRALAKHPLAEIGSHTRNHYPLHRLGSEQLRDEVVGNHRELQNVFDRAVQVEGFCAPFGYRSHMTPEAVAAIREIDNYAVTAYGGCVNESRLYGLPEIHRIGVWGNLGTLWHRMSDVEC